MQVRKLLLIGLIGVALAACDNLKSDEDLCEDYGRAETSIENYRWLVLAYEAEKAGTPWAGVVLSQQFKDGYDLTHP